MSELTGSADALASWLASDAGRYLLQQERKVLVEYFENLPGYRLMRLGLTADKQTLDCFSHYHRFSLHPSQMDPEHSALADYADLPLPSDTIDVALIHHALEYSSHPKAVLAEVNRVIAPDGHILLCLNNPYGAMGLIKFPMQLFSNQPQYQFHNLYKGRIIDWLSLLNFQVLGVYHGGYNLPFSRPHWISAGLAQGEENVPQKIRFPISNFYMIHAVKRVARGVGSIQYPQWKPLVNKDYVRSSKAAFIKHKRQIQKTVDK